MVKWPRRHVQYVKDEGETYPYYWHEQPSDEEAAELFRRCYEDFPIGPGPLIMVAVGFARMAALGYKPVDLIQALDEQMYEQRITGSAHIKTAFAELLDPIVEPGLYNRQGKPVEGESDA